jgi:hypothetical protein
MEPKYKIGDEAWMMEDNVPVQKRITVIVLIEGAVLIGAGPVYKPTAGQTWWAKAFFNGILPSSKRIESVTYGGKYIEARLYPESDFCPSKEALIQSL